MAKVVVVTGAGAGVGRSTVDEFARHGYDVALLSRDPTRVDRAAADLEANYGVRASLFQPTLRTPMPWRRRRRALNGNSD
nr:hypothetical protein HUO10_000089 [Paraburkholderia busanensis]